MTKRDVVIIGGSLSGSACVRRLQQLGIDAVAFERDRFPRPKVCGGFLSPGAVECVDRLGLLDEVRRAGGVEVTRARVRVDAVEVELPFDRAGLGISRIALDEIFAHGAPVIQGCAVHRVEPRDSGFAVDDVFCKVVIDAAGKLSRFSPRRQVDEFGIQYFTPGGSNSVLDFWFFDDGYGGGVSVEGGRSNFCFLVKKPALRRYLQREGCLVTGPIAYDRLPADFIAIGDAAGMVDPFCGEGIRHALETGVLAAEVVARGLRRRTSYAEMKWEYESRWKRRWGPRRVAFAAMRRARPLFGTALRYVPSSLFSRIWD
jgi:flavin-dependent dehydrogenase